MASRRGQYHGSQQQQGLYPVEEVHKLPKNPVAVKWPGSFTASTPGEGWLSGFGAFWVVPACLSGEVPLECCPVVDKGENRWKFKALNFEDGVKFKVDELNWLKQSSWKQILCFQWNLFLKKNICFCFYFLKDFKY